MITQDFDYILPEAQIAKYPLEKRTASRLLVVDRASQTLADRQFADIIDLIDKKDLLVCNDTRVIPARLFGVKSTGGKIECLVERILSSQRVLAHIKSSKSPKPGQRLKLAEAFEVEVIARHDALFELEFLTESSALETLHQYGAIPLPPYIDRQPEGLDKERYQTVFAKREGAVAAPTASLHFDEATLKALDEKGVDRAFVTLHVGAGTFQPVRTDSLKEHVMHKEYLEVSPQVCQKVQECRQRGGRVIALGTTVVRCLETAGQSGELKPFQGDTQLFIYPGYDFKIIDALLTNFHLPKSTLLMLVSALGGHKLIMNAYAHAVTQGYRFFSYGDAMFVK